MKYLCILLVLVLALTICESREARCLLPIESGFCYAYIERYGYDVTEQQCKKFVYGGCQGNENRFDSLEECQAAC